MSWFGFAFSGFCCSGACGTAKCVYGALPFAHKAGKPLTDPFIYSYEGLACGAALPFWVLIFGCSLASALCRWHPLCVVGLLALPLCGAAVTFFAAAKKVTKESRF
ncbi:membrane hypothetical protein [Paraburkholderia sabiae]|nr:membrane hypothetical protein [Paraburkholderia sabiae]